VLGTCGAFEEIQIGAERYNIFKQCPSVLSLLTLSNPYLRPNQPPLS